MRYILVVSVAVIDNSNGISNAARKMNRYLGFALVLACVGCGGSGGGGEVSPFKGNWEPTVSSGSLDIGSSGSFTMRIDDASIGGVDKYVGSVKSTGSFTATMTNPNLPGKRFPAEGFISMSGASRLTMSITLTNPDTGATASARESFVLAGTTVTLDVAGEGLAKLAGKVK